MDPGPEIAAKAAFFERWMVEGILYFQRGELPRTGAVFPGAESLVARHDHVAQIISEHFQTLSKLDQLAFHLGLNSVVNFFDAKKFSDQGILRQLVDVAANSRTHIALNTLAKKLKPEAEDEFTVGMVHSIVSSLERSEYYNDQGTKSTLYHLAEFKCFGTAEVRLALLALCRAEPAGLVVHLARLCRPLNQRYGAATCRRNEKRLLERRKLTSEILALLSSQPEIIGQSFLAYPDRIAAIDTALRRSSENDWWSSALTDDPEVLLRVEELTIGVAPVKMPQSACFRVVKQVRPARQLEDSEELSAAYTSRLAA